MTDTITKKETLLGIGIGVAGMYLFHRWFTPDPSAVQSTVVKNQLHDYDPSSLTRSDDPRPMSRHFRVKSSSYVVRVVLTGGPCGGKSSALKGLKEAATEHGFDVWSVPEVATTVMNAGFMWNVSQKIQFQTIVAQLQLQLERHLLQLAGEKINRPTIMIFDRGILDGKSFVNDDEWEQILKKNNYTHAKSLGRYDCVVHLVTAANGAPSFYKSNPDGQEIADDNGHTVTRRETPEEAIEQDEKLQQCWSDHPKHFIIHNNAEEVEAANTEGGTKSSTAFERKMNKAIEYILSVADDVHPRRE
jgi:predicted ATPase